MIFMVIMVVTVLFVIEENGKLGDIAVYFTQTMGILFLIYNVIYSNHLKKVLDKFEI
ncbi:hypothetical protein LCGC14_0374380 [marine sediment metagenome]|uniref:Uncharacterized protein n=1 Tax=marine sediment metagenome TaxID=412755 RepID=A0A0F9WCW7_9ZZZZ